MTACGGNVWVVRLIDDDCHVPLGLRAFFRLSLCADRKSTVLEVLVVNKNLVLLELLQKLSWSQSRLARRLNEVLGAGYVSRSTVAEWVNQERVPRDPVPTVVAHVLSEELGRTVTLDELWKGRAKRSQLWLSAFDGMTGPWCHSGTVRALECWQEHGETVLDFSHRTFFPVWGEALVGPTLSYLEHPATPLQLVQYRNWARDGRMITASMTSIASLVVERMHRLDDTEGGSLENLRFVHQYFLSIGEQIRSGDAVDSTVLGKLFRVWMSLCQVAGWMAYDAEEHGLAQRYFYSGLRAAHSIRDRTYGAYLLARLTHQAIYCRKVREARTLADATVRAAKGGPPALRSLVGGLVAHTEALEGNAYGFETNMATAQDLIEEPGAVEGQPSWMYWFGPTQSKVRRGHGLLTLARATKGSQQHRLIEAARLLAPNCAVDDTHFPREALYNRVWLARSHMWRGDIDTALHTALPALAPSAVRSPRSVAQLRILDTELAAHPAARNTSQLHDFHHQLQTLLTAFSPKVS